MKRVAALLVLAMLAVALCAATAGMTIYLWQEMAQVERLDSGLETLSSHATLSGTRVAALEATVITLESQLAHAGSGGETTTTPDVTPPSAADLEAIDAHLAELAARVEALEAPPAAITPKPAVAAEPTSPGADKRAPTPPPRIVRLDVAPRRQGHNLSCESAAASMAARYHGVDLSEAEILAALPQNANPHLGFRGDVDGSPGGTVDYGVYADPIVKVLEAHGLGALRVDGGLASIRAAIARGNPVIAWITYNCQPVSKTGAPTTITLDGETVTLVPFEHAVILKGYNAAGMWANDPWDGEEDHYATADLERCMAYFGPMAIEVTGRVVE